MTYQRITYSEVIFLEMKFVNQTPSDYLGDYSMIWSDEDNKLYRTTHNLFV